MVHGPILPASSFINHLSRSLKRHSRIQISHVSAVSRSIHSCCARCMKGTITTVTATSTAPRRGHAIQHTSTLRRRGLGHIAQVAVLPAFAHARRNSKLVAVVSDDRTKRREITRRYRLDHAFSYEQFEDCLNEVDAGTSRCPIRCTRNTPCGRRKRACTSCARSRWPSPSESASG